VATKARSKKVVPKILADKIVVVPYDSVMKYPNNPRIGNIPVIMESLRENGFFRPLIVQASTNYILDGNHTWEAAGEEGYQEVPVVFVDVDDKQARRMVLIANRAADLATYDSQLLAEVIKGLDSPVGTGY
jgi:ParB-like chromosome segregation protein Spo0J